MFNYVLGAQKEDRIGARLLKLTIFSESCHCCYHSSYVDVRTKKVNNYSSVQKVIN